MADATEVRSDSAPTPADAPAKPATEIVTAAAPAAEMAAATEAANTVETPIIAAPAAAPASALRGLAAIRSNITPAMPANRSALLAGGIGFALGAGLLLATIGAMGVGDLVAAPTPGAAAWTATAEETRALKQTIVKLEAQVAELKASIDTAARTVNTQRAQIADRDQRSTRTQAEMQTRLVKIGDALDRIEKRAAAAVATETTGSVAPGYAAAVAQPPAAEAKTPPPVATGWFIRDIFRGRALVANRRGVFEAAPGLHLPELGRVEAVTRQNGRWVVITEKGIITVMRRPRSANEAN